MAITKGEIVSFTTKAPGLEWRTRKSGDRVAVWVAPKKAVAAGFTPRTVNLSYEANPAVLAATCRRLQAEALEWASRGSKRITVQYDGTIGSLIKLYQTHDASTFNEIKYNTRKTYTSYLRTLDETVGERALHSLGAIDFKRWYAEFKKPLAEEANERLSRAHYLMNVFRMVIKFGVIIEIEECSRLQPVLSAMAFPNAKPRTAVLTADMVAAFCREARRMGRSSLGLATAIQFECALRQKDVIGEWVPVKDAPKGHGVSGKEWTGLRWGTPGISTDNVLSIITSKTQAATEVDLKHCPLVMAELQWVPPESRIGPVILSETMRRPYFQDAYCSNWRQIARAAGIPDKVWSMDARAGAISEGSSAGAPLSHLQSLATHKSLKMTGRYDRPNIEKNANVSALRVAHRVGKGSKT